MAVALLGGTTCTRRVDCFSISASVKTGFATHVAVATSENDGGIMYVQEQRHG